jgi:hypothetical protein
MPMTEERLSLLEHAIREVMNTAKWLGQPDDVKIICAEMLETISDLRVLRGSNGTAIRVILTLVGLKGILQPTRVSEICLSRYTDLSVVPVKGEHVNFLIGERDIPATVMELRHDIDNGGFVVLVEGFCEQYSLADYTELLLKAGWA